MTRKKISREHLQNLLYTFERDEKVNFFLMFYTYLNISFITLFFSGIGLYPISLFIIGLVVSIIIISYAFTRKLSLHLNKKKNKKIIPKLKQYLITGKRESDNKIENILNKLKLTERQYKISQLIYFSYVLLIISIEFLILFLFQKILVLTNPLNYNIVLVGIFYLIELSINLLLLLFQTLRYMNFKGIRQLRDFLEKIITKELTRIEVKIEKIMDLKLREFKFKRKQLLRCLQKWSDLYLGSYFVGLREQLLISDYKKITYDIRTEVYYYKLFNDLKFKIEESHLFNSLNRDKSKKKETDDPILNIIEINIKKLNTSFQSRLLEKNERRSKIRMSLTWIGTLSITLSIIFSLSRLPSLFGF